MVLALDSGFRQAAESGDHTVSTIGKLITPNGSINCVCGNVEFFLDVREVDLTRRRKFVENFRSECSAICKNRKTEMKWELLQDDKPTTLSPEYTNALAASCNELEIDYVHLPSKSAHDALIAATSGVDTAMIFVPSKRGLSHCPEEMTALDDIGFSARVLYRTLKKLLT